MLRVLRPFIAVLFGIFLSGCLHDQAGTYSISGQVKYGSGAGIAGVALQLSGASVSAAMTDANGVYSITGLADGDYTVRPILTGNTFSPASKRVTIAGASQSGVDFLGTPNTNPQNAFSISGRVTVGNSNTPIVGVTLTLALNNADLTSTTTTSDGSYNFPNLANGNYVVTPRLTNYTFTPATSSVPINDASAANINFSGTTNGNVQTYAISGSVTANNAPLSGATIRLSGGQSPISVTTNSSGQYSFTVTSGTYTVTPSLDSYTFNPANRQVTVTNSNVTVESFNATAVQTTRFEIRGRVTQDVQNVPVGITGVQILITGANEFSVIGNTDSNGAYIIPNLLPDTYTITPSHVGHSFSPQTRTETISTANITNADFSAVPTGGLTYQITGVVNLSGGNPLQGVTIDMNGGIGSTTTDNQGRYTFSNLANGTYRLTPRLTGYTFNDPFRDITVNNANVTAPTFIATAITTYSLSGRIVANGTTNGIGGVSVAATGGNTSLNVTTNNNGEYTFSNLANGSYKVTPTLANYTFSQPSRDVTINNANAVNIDFTGTAQTTTYSISGRVVLNTTTTGLSGVSVSAGQNTTTAISNSNGDFTISGLVPGQYTVTPTLANTTFNPTSSQTTITNQNITGLSFSATVTSNTNLTISGHITDRTGAMLAGVTLALSGARSATTTSGTDGGYAFTGLSNGSYSITATSQTHTFAPVNPAYNLNGISITTADFVGTPLQANSRNFSLFTAMGTITVNGTGGATIPVWAFSENGTTVTLPGPTLVVNEGDTVSITVTNTHATRSHNFVIKGITTDTTAIAPGGLKNYTFTASKAGTYLYYDSLNNNVDRSMGMYGVLIVNAAGGASTAWTNGPAYNFQRTWVTADLDKPNWNDRAGAGLDVNTTYRANYFLLNGKGGTDASNDRVGTAIEGRVGQTALVRIVNAGQYVQSFHFHANHVKVITIDGVQQTAPYKLLDVLSVPPLSTMDVLFELNQPGTYPMHNHTAQMETANGAYGNGVMTKIYISP